MQLPEKAVLRRYNALANDWTPLSRKPCWLSNAFHYKYNYMKRNRFAWFRLPILSTQIPSADNKLHCACDKSFADDLVSSRYCKRESNLCITIRWGFCGVSSICSSLIFPLIVGVRLSATFRSIWPLGWNSFGMVRNSADFGHFFSRLGTHSFWVESARNSRRKTRFLDASFGVLNLVEFGWFFALGSVWKFGGAASGRPSAWRRRQNNPPKRVYF